MNNFNKRIRAGQSIVINRIVFTKKEIALGTAMTVPIHVAIIEQDTKQQYNDTGEGTTIFPITATVPEIQTHSFQIRVVERPIGKKQKAGLFTIHIEAVIEESFDQCLEENKFQTGMGEYTQSELNTALMTIFGEISPELHAQLTEEAEAVVSTILNRKTRIEAARETYKSTQQEFEAAKTEYEKAKNRLDLARKEFTQATSDKIKYEHYVNSELQDQPITLADIVALPEQYAGTKKGTEYYQNYPTMSSTDQQRNCERWKTAKTALQTLAENPLLRKKYEEFRSNNHGEKRLLPGRERIGGNDFF